MNKDVSFKGILIGGVIGLAGGVISSVIFSLLKKILLTTVYSIRPTYTIYSFIPALCFFLSYILSALLAGYSAARIAKRGERINGTLSSWVIVVNSIASLLQGHLIAGPILWFILGPLIGYLGGCLRLRQTKRVN